MILISIELLTNLKRIKHDFENLTILQSDQLTQNSSNLYNHLDIEDEDDNILYSRRNIVYPAIESEIDKYFGDYLEEKTVFTLFFLIY